MGDSQSHVEEKVRAMMTYIPKAMTKYECIRLGWLGGADRGFKTVNFFLGDGKLDNEFN